MENILIQGTPKTPNINFNEQNGILEIKGRSIPENSIEFFNPLVKWIELYAENPQKKTELIIELEYFNTSSSKCILDVFKKLELIAEKDKEIVVKWHYEEDDEDMLEAGEDYRSIVDLPFEMVEV